MRQTAFLALLLAFALALAACGDDSTAAATPSTGAAPAQAPATPVPPPTAAAAVPSDAVPTEPAEPADPDPAPTEPEPAAAKLSANDASIDELAAAFEAAGIGNARRWAREVDEYRPYDIDDTNYTKLRGELAKYNPAPGVVDAIIAELELP